MILFIELVMGLRVKGRWKMIKIAIYKNSWSLDSEEPDEILTLKEFEEKFNKNSDNFDYCKIKFIVA